MDWKRFSMTGFKNKRPITRMYATMIALLVIVSLTGFIDRGKSVTLVADGTTRQVYTHAVNEQALMRENNIDMGDYDEIDVSTQKLADGSYVKVRRAIPVTLEYRGQKQQVYTAKHNSQEVAEQYGYNKEKYRPYGDVQKPLQAGENIVIGHVSRKTITEDEVVPYAIESIPDETLGQGEEKIVQEGQNGRKRVKLNIVSVDGQVADKETLSTELISEMQPLIRKVGTKETVEINTSTGDVSHYQKIITMEATAYLPTDATASASPAWGRGPAMASSPSIPTSSPWVRPSSSPAMA